MSRVATFILMVAAGSLLLAEERTQNFDRDPGWEGVNNRPAKPVAREIRQDFGYSPTAHAGGKPGEIGGFITSAAEPAYYGRRIPDKTFNEALSASGLLACKGDRFHVLVGFFNSDTVNEWRTPNTIALRLAGRDGLIQPWLEYCTGKWRAGGDTPLPFVTKDERKKNRNQVKNFPANGTAHAWSIQYDPSGNGGNGAIVATFGEHKFACNLAKGHKPDGARFNRFGLLNVMKHADDGGEVWLDDVTVNGATEHFDIDPGWEGCQNRRKYATSNVRPKFDFGFSPTHLAGGAKQGELGGLIFRGDCRFPDRMACYGDRFPILTLEKPLRAAGKVCLRRGVTDSTVLIGFYHSQASMNSNPAQDSGLPKNFLGAVVEGPSREGFQFYPAYRLQGNEPGIGRSSDSPHIYPDGKAHDWTLEYDPAAASGNGKITVVLDGKPVAVDLKTQERKAGAQFDRFGIVTTWIDGNGQHVYFDDLRYTCRQE